MMERRYHSPGVEREHGILHFALYVGGMLIGYEAEFTFVYNSD